MRNLLLAGVSLICCGHGSQLNCVPLKRFAFILTPRTCGYEPFWKFFNDVMKDLNENELVLE